MPYCHLSEHERYLISHQHAYGWSCRKIAAQLGRHPGTISRELRRNRATGAGYAGIDAHERAQRRRHQAQRTRQLDSGRLLEYVSARLRRLWSPQQIAERMAIDYRDAPAMRLSHESIYQWVYQNRRDGGDMYQCLRRQRPRRRKHRRNSGTRGQIPGRVSIEQRPAIVDSRQRFGDWETDTVEGAKGRGCLVTHVERRSRYLLAGPAADRRALTFNQATIRLFSSVPRSLRHTLTADNGKELALFKPLEQTLGLRVYFAHPYSAWERGSNENTNGLLRQFFPKGMPLDAVTDEQVAKAVNLLNNRPRKCLGYRTPREVLPRGVALQT